MKKSNIIEKMAEKNPHLSISDSELIVNTILSEIIKALKNKKRVELRGFGIFSTRLRNARKSRNPKTGEAVMVEEKTVPFFKSGKLLKERINK
ncbi:MAG: integration host factor subunit beta [Alphaproteobacteria bacterium]|jgi:integration host factor subunit beta|nr:integration host factor subunit beta [Alphaproteobacteria bacterium]MCV6599181.1 integration host factor subunit beta [Alphaproteobacteria bacterium]